MTEARRIHISGLLPCYARSLPRTLRDYSRARKSGFAAEIGSMVLPPEQLFNFGFLEKKYLSLHAPVTATLVTPTTAKFDDLIQRLFFIFTAEVIKSGAVQPVGLLISVPDEVFKTDDEDFYLDFFGAVNDAVECQVDQEFEIFYSVPAFHNPEVLVAALTRLNSEIIPERQVHCLANGLQIPLSVSVENTDFAQTCIGQQIPVRLTECSDQQMTGIISQLDSYAAFSVDVPDYQAAAAIVELMQTGGFQRSL
jgi:hypothetical protein